ncbi:hypothetical protein MPER_02447 [Moniliophthora perniciosa FA553]|nr:hypothetical protein MPER_02447 [Moniliophthora perniciosa FA553]
MNKVGEYGLKGGNISSGYYNNEAPTKETFVNGWLRTGDKFRVDQDGYFFFADRAKDTLKVSGIQVSPVEIEDVLLTQPDKLITDITVAGVQGHGRTSDEKVPRAWIVLSEEGKKRGAPTVIKALEEWQQENLSKFKWLRGGIEVVKEVYPKVADWKGIAPSVGGTVRAAYTEIEGKVMIPPLRNYVPAFAAIYL